MAQSIGEQNRQQFADTFNRLMQGKRTQKMYTDEDYKKMDLSVHQQAAASAGAKPKRKPTDPPKEKKEEKPKSSGLAAVEREQFLAARQKELQKEAEDQPWYKDILKPVGTAFDIIDTPRAFITSGIKETVDTIYGSRVGEWMDNAMGRTPEERQADLERMGTGSWKDFKDQGWSNIGFGDVWASTRDETEKNKWLDRAVGLAGDIGLDPTTYVGVGVASRVTEPVAKKLGIETTDRAVRATAKAVDAANKAQAVAAKAKAGARAVARATDAQKKADDLMAQLKVKYPKIDVNTNEFTTQFLKTGGPKGSGAYRSSIRLIADDVADSFDFLKSPLDKEVAKTVQRSRLIDDFERGALQADELISEYAKITPNSSVIKKLQAGKLTIDDAVEQLKLYKPVVTKETMELASAPVARIINRALEKLDSVVYDISGGGTKGKLIGTPREVVPSIANTMTEEFKYARLYPTNKRISEFTSNVDRITKTGASKIDPKVIKAARGKDPLLDEWITEFQKHLPKDMTDEALMTVAKNKAHQKVAELVEEEMMRFHSTVHSALMDSVNRAPTLRVFGQDLMTFPRVGNLGRKAGNAFNDSRFGTAWNKAFRYSSNWPGYTTYLGNKARSLGVKNYEDFKSRVAAKAKELDLSREEARQLQHNLQNGIRGTGKMQEAFDFVKEQYDQIYKDELEAGIYDANVPRLTDYAYTHVYRSKLPNKKIDQLRVEKRNAVRKNRSLSGYTTDELRSKGFKVEGDAFTNLLYRRMKSNRELTKAYFYKDLVVHYGIKSPHMQQSEKLGRNLIEIPRNKQDFIAKDFLDTLKPGDSLYLDRNVYDMYKQYENLQKNADEVFKVFDFITRKFKTWNTIYFPGYHVRNIIGDTIMGIFDGVKTRDYATVMKNWHKRSTATIHVGGKTTSYNRLHQAFLDNLSSGSYVDAELSKGINRARTLPGTIRQLSEGREDFGRFVHFYRAMDDEYGALLKSGVSEEKAWDQAIVRSMARVNQFKFDYAALTPFEMKYMRRGIPFYTYTRKAVPTLLESLLMQPKYLVTINKMQENLADRYSTEQLPDWMREIGYMKLNDDWGMSDVLLPTAVLRDAFSNPASRVNPLMQIPFEAQTGEDLFTGRPVEGMGDILMNKWRGFNTIYRPGARDSLLENENLSGSEKWLRLAGFPVSKVGEKQSTQALTEIRFKVVDRIERMNSTVEKKGYTIFLSERNDGMSIRLKDKVSGAIIWEGESLEEAQKAINRL